MRALEPVAVDSPELVRAERLSAAVLALAAAAERVCEKRATTESATTTSAARSRCSRASIRRPSTGRRSRFKPDDLRRRRARPRRARAAPGRHGDSGPLRGGRNRGPVRAGRFDRDRHGPHRRAGRARGHEEGPVSAESPASVIWRRLRRRQAAPSAARTQNRNPN